MHHTERSEKMLAASCCDDFKRAQNSGTDNEGYGRLLSNLGRDQVAADRWSIGSNLPNIKFCPWCGVATRGERDAFVADKKQRWPRAKSLQYAWAQWWAAENLALDLARGCTLVKEGERWRKHQNGRSIGYKCWVSPEAVRCACDLGLIEARGDSAWASDNYIQSENVR